jgi:hypothetical protein
MRKALDGGGKGAAKGNIVGVKRQLCRGVGITIAPAMAYPCGANSKGIYL